MGWFTRILGRTGGVVRTAELYEGGETQSILHWSVKRRSIVRARVGVYCDPELPEQAIRAQRVGGRLACVSALAHHGLGPEPEALHVAVPGNTPRVRDPDTGRPGRSPEVVLHWSRRELAGDRVAVSEEVARRQAARCRALARDSL